MSLSGLMYLCICLQGISGEWVKRRGHISPFNKRRIHHHHHIYIIYLMNKLNWIIASVTLNYCCCRKYCPKYLCGRLKAVSIPLSEVCYLRCIWLPHSRAFIRGAAGIAASSVSGSKSDLFSNSYCPLSCSLWLAHQSPQIVSFMPKEQNAS